MVNPAKSKGFSVGESFANSPIRIPSIPTLETCLLYTSDAADERSSVDLGGRRIIKKKIDRRDILQHTHR